MHCNKRPIKAILFDLDDTLWPIMPAILRAETVLFEWLTIHAPTVAQQYSIDSLRKKRLALMATDIRYATDLWALRHAALTEVLESCGEDPRLADQAMEIFSAARNAVQLYEDVMPALTSLQQRFLLGSVSNGAADLEMIGIAHLFQVSIAARHFGRPKPDPAIFHAACDALDVAPGQAVYVGDDPLLDVEGAQKAGMLAVWMTRAGLEFSSSLPNNVRPDAICTTLHELDQWLTGRIIVEPASGAR